MLDHSRSLGDADLLSALKNLVAGERRCLVELLAHLAELDRRRLWQREGYSSLYVYCVKELGYSEGAAYRRAQVARASRSFPEILSYLTDGAPSLSALATLAPYLDQSNCADLLERAKFKNRRELETVVAAFQPRHVEADTIRKVSQDRLVQGELVQPLSTQRFRLSFTADLGLLDKFERARDLLRHKHPTGRLEDVFAETLEVFLDRKDPQRRSRPRTSSAAPKELSLREAPRQGASRYIPQSVKDEVWSRDGGRCSYMSPDGRHCEERGGLEYDHVRPWARGGTSSDPANIRLLCRTHNRFAAVQAFGEGHMERFGREKQRPG
ncbi:MAG: HNH endonuclease [Elusimicrobia bacterium]|nr:HNH endonuclease [Elusimicrobiota bacterium]